jgi:hypothetical protein
MFHDVAQQGEASFAALERRVRQQAFQLLQNRVSPRRSLRPSICNERPHITHSQPHTLRQTAFEITVTLIGHSSQPVTPPALAVSELVPHKRIDTGRALADRRGLPDPISFDFSLTKYRERSQGSTCSDL